MRAKEILNKQQGVAEGATVTRIDSKPITDFASNLNTYKHTDDWSQSGLDTGDDSYWTKRNIKPNTSKGLFAGDPHRTALYATGNANETRYVEYTENGQPVVYFDEKDLPAIRARKTYLSVFDASDFRKLPSGEWFSEHPSKPIKQIPINDPFKYIESQGWKIRITNDLNKVLKKVQQLQKVGKIDHYGAEGMNESKQGVAEGTLNEIYKMPPTKNSSQGLAAWAYHDAVEKNSKIIFQDSNTIVFQVGADMIRYIILSQGKPILYLGLTKFLDGWKSGVVAAELEARGQGLATKIYLQASDLLNQPIYSDTTQTDASRLGIWNKLIQMVPGRVVGFDQKTNNDLPITMTKDGPVVNQNQPLYIDRNKKDSEKPVTQQQRYRTRILKLLPNKQGVAEAAVPGSVTFAGKDPNEFKSPKGGKPVMVIQTEQGSRYLITSDGMVLRHKSVHANTGGEDAGLKDWSDKIEFYDRSKPLIAGGMQPLSFPDAVAHLADQGRIALSTGKSGARVAVILDNGNWRPATIADAMPKAAAAKLEWAKIVIKADAGTWGSQPKLGWQPLDYNQRGDGTLNRVHNGSPVSHGAKVAQGVAEAAQNDLSTIIQSFVASPAGQKYKQHDCKTVTRAFVAWAEQNKITTQVVSLAPPSAEFIAKNPRYKGKSGQGDGHIMPIVNGNAIDFTVRQFGVGRPFENPLITPTNSLPAVYGKFGYFTDKPEWFLGGKSHWIGSLNSIPSEIFNQNFGDELLEQGVAEAWSEKYKKSINCKNPRGFSQRAHCQGRKKNNEQVELDERKRKRKKKTARYYYGPAYYFGATDTGAEGGDGGGLEEDWKKSLANVGLAGAIGLGAAGGLELKDKIKSAFTKPTAQTTQPVQAKSQQVQVSPITNNPLETYLMNVAKKSGLTGIELAQFLGQCAHETMDYKRMIERGAKKYFNKYEPKFAPGKAKLLGNVKSGDGERYKGRGYIQLTGRYNYKMAGKALNLPLEQNPELAAQPEIAAKIALWYWGQRVKSEIQNFADTTSVTRKINPGLSGLEDRHENFLSYMAQRDD